MQAQQIMRQQQMIMKQQMLNAAVPGDGKILSNAFAFNSPEMTKKAVEAVNRLREELKKGKSQVRLIGKDCVLTRVSFL